MAGGESQWELLPFTGSVAWREEKRLRNEKASSSISITWEFERNAASWAPPRPADSHTLELEPSKQALQVTLMHTQV